MEAPRMEAGSPRWLWMAAIWSGVALFDATQTVFTMRSQGMHHAWVQLFVMQMLAWLPWALATPFVIRLGRRYAPFQSRSVSTWGVHLGAAAGIGLVAAAWVASLEVVLNPWAQPGSPGPFMEIWLPRFYNSFLASLLLYAFILAIRLVLDAKQRMVVQQTETARLNEQLSKAQMNALRRQLEPHFLFNTLNAISGLVREKQNDAAVDMIVGLSEFLRRALEESDRSQVPLAQEVDFLRLYLDIQKVRFADRLQLSLDVPADMLAVQVPSLVLQSLVENAIKHGIAKRARGGAIRIAAMRCGGKLSLSVYNDGPCLPADWEHPRRGTGLSNLRARLQILYGSAFEFTLRNQDARGVEASVSVPIMEA